MTLNPLTLCCRLVCSAGRTERSALKVLREQVFAHKSDLLCAIKRFDRNNTGVWRDGPGTGSGPQRIGCFLVLLGIIVLPLFGSHKKRDT